MSRLRLGPHIARSALAITLILVGLWLAGRLLGDGSWWTGLLYYIPTPVPIVACAAAAILLRRARPRHALLALVLTLMLTTHWASTEVRWTRSVDSAANTDLPTLRLVHWNVFRNFLPWQGKIERLRRLEADIYVLNELPRQVARGNWALKLGPGMDYAQGQLMMVACRGKVLSQKLEIDPGLITLWVECELYPPADDSPADDPSADLVIEPKEKPLTVSILAVDMSANPLMARDPVLAHLVAKIAERQPDLIAGDFNAPRRSRRLQQLPTGYRHAYDVAGSGWPYTWPMPLPLLAIDQCIVGPRIDPRSFRYVSTGSSDHRLQVLEWAPRARQRHGLGAPGFSPW